MEPTALQETDDEENTGNTARKINLSQKNIKQVDDTVFLRCLPLKDLIAYKSFSFFIFGGFGAFYPFLPLYFKSYGLSTFQAGSIVGIRPVIQFIGAPFWSEIGERFRIKKYVLMGGILAWILKALLLWAVDPKHQLCIEAYTNSSTNITSIHSVNLWKPMDTNQRKKLTIAEKKSQVIELIKLLEDKAEKVDTLMKLLNAEKSESLFKTFQTSNQEKHIQITSVAVRFDKTLNKTLTYFIEVDTDEINYLYLIFLMIIIIGEFLESPTYTLSDSSLLNRLGEERQYYGQIRLWGAIGWAISSASAGAILYATRYLMCAVLLYDYQVIFYIYFGFVSCAFSCVYWFSFQMVDEQEKSSLPKALKVLCSLDHMTFLVTILFTGCCYGFLFHFVNWYIDDKGGSTLVMGAAGAARELGEMTLFLLGGGCVRFLGNLNCMAVSLIGYAACFYWYSIIHSPWMAVPLEALDGAIYGLVWSNSVNYMSSLGAPTGSVVIMQGILQAVFYGLGNGGGTVLGGHLYEAIGSQMTFHYFAISSLIILLFLLIFFPLSKPLMYRCSGYTPIPDSSEIESENLASQ